MLGLTACAASRRCGTLASMPDRRLLTSLGLGCILILGCATPAPPEPVRSYEFFGALDDKDPWVDKVQDWQTRARSHGHVTSPIAALSRGASPSPHSKQPTPHVLLSTKIGVYDSAARVQLARGINSWAQFEAYEHYKAEANTDFDLDHWPTFKELLETDGDDCDGLDLIAYELLREFGYERVYRAIVRRERDGVNHMVTLWFQDRDPWVLDATGAMSMDMQKISQVSGWTPTHMFSETEEYTVLENDAHPVARLK